MTEEENLVSEGVFIAPASEDDRLDCAQEMTGVILYEQLNP
ncbi:MAG TPA: hypothetical protein VIK64_03980 [Anaerolineales bacterium]